MTPASEQTPNPEAQASESDSQPQVTDIKAPDGSRSAASFGFNAYAERINGRFAMVGFVALLVQEAITHQDFFTWIGLR
ncbi:hypothetical protein C7271_22305 [filamentous cyanobacterium CCP5]|nr:hypothetical protein C7271_22305 [filamentous cyanobacterium CCP5]